MVVTCPNCGTSNRSLATFCMKCVTSLSNSFGDRQENAFAEVGDIEVGAAATLRVSRTARWATGREGDCSGSDFREFAEHALPDGTLIEGFRIVRSIGEGGFGIVYLAWDAALERHVAIKEYMPTSLAVRADPSLEVAMRSDRHRSTFEAGLKSFVNEARLLARFDHPALVKVFRFWEANRTAYMAMPFYEGPTLKSTLSATDNPVSESQLRAWMDPLLDALAVLHREHCYHRDISPDNILLTTSGPVLLDFGAARRVISDMTQALTAVLKPGFAPIEQYGGELQQGPWTDLYALAGVVHYAITGRAPTASVVRAVSDTLRPLAVTQAGKYSDSFLRAIDAALSVRPEARPQDVAEFRALLGADQSLHTTAALTDKPESVGPASLEATHVVRTAPDAIGVGVQPDPPAMAHVARRSRKGRYFVAAVCLIVAGSTVWWTKHPSGERVSSAVPAGSAPTRSVATPAPSAAVMLPLPLPLPSSPSPSSPSSPSPNVATQAVPVATASASATLQSAAKATTEPRSAVRTSLSVLTERQKQKVVIPSADALHREVDTGSAAVRKVAARPPRCADIIQKLSLESLNPDEVAYLKKECR